jgi:hypothetical protein
MLMFALVLSIAYAGDLSAIVASQSGDPGSSASFSLVLTNSGATDLVVSSTSTVLTDTSGNTISAPTIGSTTVTAGNSATVTFTVSIPSTEAGAYTGTITSTDGGANTATTSYTLTVNSKNAFTATPDPLEFESYGEADSKKLTITNTGSTTLSSWNLTFTSDDGDTGKILDDDDDEITIKTTSPSSSLAPGDSMEITVTADPDSSVSIGEYSGDMAISATGSSTVSDSIEINVNIETELCEEGVKGNDLEVRIDNPDSGDDFAPGETINVQVKVDNDGSDDLDVVVELILYNKDQSDKVEVMKEEGQVDEDDTTNFYFDLELPADLDEDDDYVIYAVAYEDGEEDRNCNYESISIDLEREDEDAILTKVSVSPAIGLTCGETYRVSMQVESAGSDEIENLYVELRDADLEVQKSSESFDLDDYEGDQNTKSLNFDFEVPKGLEAGTYSIEAILYNDKGNVMDSELIDIAIEACEGNTAEDLLVNILEDYKVEGYELTLPVEIVNNGNEDIEITITSEEVSWASLTGTEYLKSLQAGDEAHAYLYYTLDAETSGKHDLKVIVTDNEGNQVTEIVTIDFGEKETSAWENFSLDKMSGTFWIVVDLVLVLLAAVFLAILFRRK